MIGQSDVTPRTGTSPERRTDRIAAVLLLLQFVGMWAAFLVLMPAINWPASLDEPPSVMLPLLIDQGGAVFTGYSFYLIHALLLIPLAVLLRESLRMTPTLGRVAMVLGVLAGLAKALGIVRWLFLMPALAAAYVDPAATEPARAALEVVYAAFNAYSGGVGELLGVGLFAGVWTLMLSVALLRVGARFLAVSGCVAGLGLLSTLPSVIGLESPLLLTLTGIVWQFWTAALAVRLLRGIGGAKA